MLDLTAADVGRCDGGDDGGGVAGDDAMFVVVAVIANAGGGPARRPRALAQGCSCQNGRPPGGEGRARLGQSRA